MSVKNQTKEETGYTSKDVDGVEGRAGIIFICKIPNSQTFPKGEPVN